MKPFREAVREILEGMELDHDNACGDPECCGERAYYVGGEGLEEAIGKILTAFEELVPEAKITNAYGGSGNQAALGFNDCRSKILKRINEATRK